MAAALAVALAGCGPGPNAKKDDKKAKPDEKPLPSQTVMTTGGNALFRGPNREPRWFVKWKSAAIDVGDVPATTQGKKTEVGVRGGSMDGVSGNLFDKSKESTKFSADGGLADRSKQTLTLQGHVRVESLDNGKPGTKEALPPVVLTCDRMIYDAAKKVIRAQGHVQVVGKVGTIGTLSEIWATPDLKLVATPDMFKPK